jgi:hypothetical protein
MSQYKKTYSLGAIVAGASYNLVPDGLMENAILRSAVIINNSDEDLKISLNGATDKYYRIPSGMVGELEDEPFQWLLFKNESATDTAADEVTVVISLQGKIMSGGIT